jgi:hypothetical protein
MRKKATFAPVGVQAVRVQKFTLAYCAHAIARKAPRILPRRGEGRNAGGAALSNVELITALLSCNRQLALVCLQLRIINGVVSLLTTEVNLRVSSPDRARDAIDLVAATVDAPAGMVEHAILRKDPVDGRAPTRGVVFRRRREDCGSATSICCRTWLVSSRHRVRLVADSPHNAGICPSALPPVCPARLPSAGEVARELRDGPRLVAREVFDRGGRR